MALSKDRIVIEGDAADAIREYSKLLDQNVQLKQQMRDLRKEAKGASDDMSGGLSKTGKELLNQAVSWLSVGAAVAGVTRAYQEQLRIGKELAEQSDKLTDSLAKALSAAGDTRQAPLIKAALEAMPAPSVGMQGRVSAYQAVRGTMPNAPLGRVLSVTAQALRAEDAGAVPSELGSLAGALAGVFPQWSSGRAADMAFVLQQAAGRRGGKMDTEGLKVISQWAEAGIGSPEQGLGLLLAAGEAGQKGTAITTLIAKLTEQKRVTEKGAEGRLLRSFYAEKDPQARLGMLSGNRPLLTALFDAQAPAMAAMLRRRPEEYAGLLGGAEGAISRAAADLMKLPGFAQVQAAREYEVASELAGMSGPVAEKERRVQAVVAAARARRRVRQPWAVESLADWEVGFTARTLGPAHAARAYLPAAEADKFIATFYGEGDGGGAVASAAAKSAESLARYLGTMAGDVGRMMTRPWAMANAPHGE
ncbi:MAG TPA: hypothetical protein PLE19_12730 [Planctomycetota bacterium]|nr:hypothetical protein [Planctomycetota bacterium]HRT95520.1 hypothetical protein [Planctomycetota bacterium]